MRSNLAQRQFSHQDCLQFAICYPLGPALCRPTMEAGTPHTAESEWDNRQGPWVNGDWSEGSPSWEIRGRGCQSCLQSSHGSTTQHSWDFLESDAPPFATKHPQRRMSAWALLAPLWRTFGGVGLTSKLLLQKKTSKTSCACCKPS